MARNKKSNPTQEIVEAINTVPDLDWGDVAENLQITIPDLQERMASKVGNIAISWELIPSEHLPVIDAIAVDLEAERSVRRLNETTEPAIEQQPPASELELPILEEEPQLKKRGGRKKKDSTALTKKKSNEIQQTRQDAAEVTDGIAETLIEFNAMEGLQDSSNAATAYLTAFSTNLINKKGEGATVIAAEILTRTAKKQNFSPKEVLERLGVPLSDETRSKLSNVMGEMQGELQEATEEMGDTAWGNGFNPQEALTRLRNLRNWNN